VNEVVGRALHNAEADGISGRVNLLRVLARLGYPKPAIERLTHDMPLLLPKSGYGADGEWLMIAVGEGITALRQAGLQEALAKFASRAAGFGCPCCSRRGVFCVLFAARWTRYLNSVSAADP
jgi:hypothetical protein